MANIHPIASGFYNWKETFPFVSPLVAEASSILEELNVNVNATLMTTQQIDCQQCNIQTGIKCKTCKAEQVWRDWPETNLYKQKQGEQNQEWKVVPLCYSFPADDEKNTVWVDANEKRFPQTCALLRSIPGIRTALFSRLGPKTSLVSHQGWAQLSNHVLRCHISLSLPVSSPVLEHNSNDSFSGHPPCGIIVGEEIQYHEMGNVIVFDDSLLHSAFNKSKENRIVLIVDIVRPATAPKGSAEKGKTEELEAFIKEFH